MPNWCQNTLMIRGTKKDVDEFKKDFVKKILKKHKRSDGTEFEIEELEFRYGNIVPLGENEDSWDYDKALTEWGSKWSASNIDQCNDSDSEDDEEDVYIEYIFETPWGPSDKLFRVLFERFNKLDFTLTFEESGCVFAGMIESVKGDIIRDEIHDDLEAYVFCYENISDDYPLGVNREPNFFHKKNNKIYRAGTDDVEDIVLESCNRIKVGLNKTEGYYVGFIIDEYNKDRKYDEIVYYGANVLEYEPYVVFIMKEEEWNRQI